MKTRFQEEAKELIDVHAPNLWSTFKNSMLQPCDEVCVERRKEEEIMGMHDGGVKKLKKAIQQ